ncbi:type I secretion system permease/ATPase [Pelagicoccus sp. SDUM812003]|uniref:type I secretion system permease/ATPase n=1 Tax=Pelagicoccus sp. SDUM812003 TaxID=3041267 RepID=UPI00280DE1F2|nr:type I secretion system permease/ATPase [Pelagicoccus sp. SDUM812003]MDQ8204937.1 type I secretion system permease/ATPase [Pelagicoccus sp. SDUM812003]
MISDQNKQRLAPAGAGPTRRAKAPASPPKAEPKETAEPAVNPIDDPLLDSLVLLGKLHDRQLSPDMLVAGLPLVENRLTPRLFVRAAESAGFSARIVKRDLSSIPQLVYPCVLLLKNNRAALLVGKNESGYRIVLPETGSGEELLDEATLKSEYIGSAIFVKPEFKFDARADKAEQHVRSKNWFWGTLWKYRGVYRNVLLAAVFINLFAIAGSLFVMNVYDRVIPNNAMDTLWVLASGVTLVYCFDFLLKMLRGALIDKAGKNADVLLSSFIFQRVLGIKMENKPASAGSFANQVKGYESLREFFTSASLATIVDLPFVIFFIAFMYFLAGWIALIPLAGIVLILVVGSILHIPLRKAAEISQGASAQKHALLVEAIGGFEAIRGLSAGGLFQRRMENFLGSSAKSEVATRRISSAATNFTVFITQMVSVIIVVASVYRIREGEMSMGALIGCTILSGRAMGPIGQVAALLSRLQQSLVSLKGLNEIVDLPQERDPGRNYIRKADFKPSIEFKEVTFAYSEDSEPAVRNASFTIEPGEKVAILGRVGSGKSTLLRLILGFYQPTSGMILVNGTDIRQLDPAELRRRLGYIAQDNSLFFGSLKENILMGAPWADEEQLLEASRLSGVERYASRHPLGYDLPIGERGERLSGGQRQAINIARAILPKPPVLVMDEPTSAMDANAEREFIANMEKYGNEGGRTLVLSTHKPSMLKLADRIIVMDQGRIAANGPKAEVMRQLSAGAGRN